MIVVVHVVDERDSVSYTGVYSMREWRDRVQRIVDVEGFTVHTALPLSIGWAQRRLEGIPWIESVRGDECIFVNANVETVVEVLNTFSPR